ncbi:MAG: tetratricopeptide repeat protein [Alphaproteobacteria bacterium]|nr:tetratricopeptide repeat protein [Alphaproteobacteria bacterium]MBF0128917.1 tetratricopeptide repeat protein [Alphaproteobacteria bacterium]
MPSHRGRMEREGFARIAGRALAALLVAATPAACAGGGGEPNPGSGLRENGPGSYLAARHAQAQRDFGSAAEFYDKALDEDPNNIDLLRRAYALFAAEGDIDTSVGIIHRLVALGESSPVTALVLSVKAARNDDYAGIEKLLEPMPRHGLSSFVIPLMLAWAQAGQGRIDAALETAAALAKREQLGTLYHFHAGMINDLADRREAAAEHYRQTLAAEGGLSLRAVEVIGSFHLRSGERGKAQELYDKYLLEHPETVLLDNLLKGLDGKSPPARVVNSARVGLAETLFGAATSVREGNALDSSLLFVRLALAVQPDFPLAQVLAGDILQSQGRYDEANKIYSSIAADAPVYYSSRLRIADNMKRLKNSAGAIRILEELADKRPDRPDALAELGDVLRGEKRFTEAAVAYGNALARIKTLDSGNWTLFYSRGIAFERSQQWAKAEADFKKALELEPEQPYVLNYLGYSWLEQKVNIDQAKAMIRKAVEKRPEDGYIVDSLGWSLYLTGDYPGSVRELERAVELQPDDPVINDHLGDAYWRVGRYTDARFQWVRSLSLNPDPENIGPTKLKLGGGLEALAAPDHAK